MRKNQNIKIIFTDIDWTILNHGHGKHVYDMKSVNALKKAQENGVKVFISTARPYESLKLTGFFDIFKPDGMVLSNGGVIFIGNEIIYHDHMSPELVERISDIAKKRHLVIQYVSEYDRWLSDPVDEIAQHYFDVYFEKLPEIRGYNGENVSGLLLFCEAKDDEEIIKEINHPELDVFRLFPYAIDIRHHLIRKNDGVKRVLEYYGYSGEDALALGDDVPDIPMFLLCKNSVAMGNGLEKVKKASTYVTSHIDKHGVRKALKHFKLI